MKKIAALFFIYIIFLQISCAASSTKFMSIPDKQKNAENIFNEKVIQKTSSIHEKISQNEETSLGTVILSDPNLNLQLCSSQITDLMYNNLFIQYRGQILPISGSTLNNTMFNASLWPFDNNKKVAITLISGEGSGVLLMDLHIIDLLSMTELLYESPLSYLDSHLDSEMNDGIVSLTLPNQLFSFDIRGIDSDNLYEKATYGGIIKYYVKDDTIFADIHIQISPTTNLGYVTLKYKFQENKYTITQMDFFLYEDNQIPCQISQK
ncbi:MAG TPA: hypothetical protein H9761_05725 [Candidatus Eisenbergiella merdavium]|uniref:DUF4292 domain-containing protein n=1 Tax=Candidatus Eisenbergiella merdavium TaxID=2838551 RepID=A0A9D2SP95_9FIRM|nr:hypothetical protein [Candidatus Eisenbergiella merdavium]